jgi:hypothetical protein
VDFAEWKKKHPTPKADFRNPWMGLDGVVCENPAYWCRLHEIWLSEDDVAKKKCLSRMSYNMLEIRKCNCLERKDKNPFIFTKKE